jgi:hypothetical protein
MRRIKLVVLLIFVACGLGACSKKSTPTIAVAQPSASQPAAAVEQVADRVAAPDVKETTSATSGSEEQAVCEDLEKRISDIDPGFSKTFGDAEASGGVKIEKRGWTNDGPDKDYKALKECLRNADNNLRQETPLLSFGSSWINELRFGMTKEEIEKAGLFGGATIGPQWHLDRCSQVDPVNAAAMYPTVSTCMYWHGNEISGPQDKQYLQVQFDSDGKLRLWDYTEFYEKRRPNDRVSGWKSSSAVIRAHRTEKSLSNLGIPDTEDEHQASWYFYSRSEKNKHGLPKILEMVALDVSKQGNYWAITTTYSDRTKDL